MLVLLPFLSPQVLLAFGGEGDRVETTLAYYGPAIAAIWLAGHATILHVQRGRHLRSLTMDGVAVGTVTLGSVTLEQQPGRS